MTDHLKEKSPASASASAAAPARRGYPLRAMAVDIVAPIFARSGFWRILRTGALSGHSKGLGA
jgi:hypothetical protein